MSRGRKIVEVPLGGRGAGKTVATLAALRDDAFKAGFDAGVIARAAVVNLTGAEPVLEGEAYEAVRAEALAAYRRIR